MSLFRRAPEQKPPVSQDTVDHCIAYAVAEGDIVNFRFLFLPYSPLRNKSTEDIHSGKYAYLRPEDENEDRFRAALGLLKQVETRSHVRAQLEKDGPPQLPSELVLALADNAVRLGKYTAAAQAYELLRVRAKEQTAFIEAADAALDRGDIAQAVRGYRIATGLNYDYAAFPEPLPAVPNHQQRALILHADYPERPEDSLPLQPVEQHVQTALAYLLSDDTAAARIAERPLDTQVEFLITLIHAQDPEWAAFAERYHEACAIAQHLQEALEQRRKQEEDMAAARMTEAISDDAAVENAILIPQTLLGRVIDKGEWWQYLKELAYLHPAAALFVARQAVNMDFEIIVPRLRKDSPLPGRLGLLAD